jgi:hypothetical protein
MWVLVVAALLAGLWIGLKIGGERAVRAVARTQHQGLRRQAGFRK